jgi:hypothetical protein
MRFLKTWNRFLQQLGRDRQKRRPVPYRSRLRLEELEGRTVPSTLNIDAAGNAVYTASTGVANNVTLTEKIIPHKFFQQDVLVISDTAETISVSGPGAAFCTGGGTHQVTFSSFSFPINSITVDTVDGNDTVNVLADAVPTVVKHSSNFGILTVNVGNPTNGVQAITAALTVDGVAFGTTNVNVDNSADPTSHNSGSGVTLSSTAIVGLAPAAINYVQGGFGTLNVTVTAGSGAYSDDVASTPINGLFESGSMTLNTGLGLNQVFVHTTSSPLTIQGRGGPDQVFIIGDGPGFDLQDIRGSVTVRNTTASTQLTVDDSGDFTPHPTVTLSDSALTGLAPAPIFYQASGLNTKVGTAGLAVGLGLGNDTITITNTPPNTTVSMGALSQRINVEGLTGSLGIFDLFNAHPTIVVGSNASGSGGTLANINGTLTLWSIDFGNVIVDDSGDTTSRTLNKTASGAFDTITGLAPKATININLGVGASNLTINGGSANNTYNLGATFLATTVNGGNGNDTFNVTGPGSYTLNTGTGANQVNVRGPAAVNVVGHGGNDTVTVGSLAPALGGTLLNFQPVTVSNTTNSTALIIDDSGDPVARTVTIGANSVQFSGIGAPITFLAGVKSVDIFGGSNATYQLSLSPPATPVTIHGGAGSSTLVSGGFVNNWTITGLNAGTLQDVTFQNVQNLRGSVLAFAHDTFVFNPTAGVTGTIVGASGPNTISTLDYSKLTTPVTVNLKTHKATGVGTAVFHIEDVTGGQGNNILVGDGNNNVLKGGSGRNLLISGGGNSTLQAGSGEAILIGAHLVFDTDFACLNAVMAEWSHTYDASNPLHDYQIRVFHLENGGGLNGPCRLNTSTMLPQPGTTTLTSGAQFDFLIFDATDILTHPLRSGEISLFV